MLDRPWFEKWPGSLERELRALGDLGVEYQIDDGAYRAGVLKLRLSTAGSVLGDHELEVIYPDEFPFFRPEVAAPSLDLPRHQNPFAKNLCLLGRRTINWDADRTLADLLEEQFPKVLEQGPLTDPDILSEIEGEQAEPRSTYYQYEPGAFVLWDPSESVPEGTDRGIVVLESPGGGRVFWGSLVQVKDHRGRVVSESLPVPPGKFARRDGFRWTRTEPPPHQTPQELLRWVQRRHSWVVGRLERGIRWGNRRCGVAGLLYSEETSPGQHDDTWLFIVREEDADGRSRTYLARPAPYSEERMFERVPELGFLRGATVAQAGTGCLGAPIALELARCGVGALHLMDPDVVESGTTVRWPMGVGAIGQPKVALLSEYISRSYPFTRCRALPWGIGQTYIPPAGEEFRTARDVIAHWVESADVILDTTAEWGVHFYLSELARDRGIPYVTVNGTQGGWGGAVFRALPGEGPCWGCLAHWREAKSLPLPPEAPDDIGLVQPRGCADPTFTGAGFDLGQVALAGARYTVMTLSSRLGGGYPDVSGNYATVSLRSDGGEAIAPSWTTRQIDPHPDCSCAAQ